MKKRIIILFLAALMLLSFASCKKDGPEENTTTAEKTTTAPAEDSRSAAVSTLPEGLNFGNIELNLAVRDREDILFEIDPDANTVDVLTQDIARRNESAQDTLGVAFQLKRIPGTYAEKGQFQTQVRLNAQAGSEDIYDVVFGPNYSLIPLMLEGYFTNLNEMQYLNLDNPWWNQNFIEECSYLEKLYMVEGELTLSMLDSAFVIFFDTQLYNSFTGGEESLYDVVSDREWTLEKLKSIVKDVYVNEGEETKDSADTFGMVSPAFACGRDGFPTAFNVRVAWKSSEGKIVSDFVTSRNINIYDDFYAFVHETEGVFVNGNTDGARTECQSMFQTGRSMFISELLNYANIIRGLERDYGVLPLPMYDDSQEDYSTNSEAVHSQISFVKASSRGDAASALIEQMCYLTYRDVTADYYTTVKYRNMREEESTRMMDIILGSITTSFGAQFSTEIQSPFPTPMGEEKDVATLLQSNKEMVDTLLLKLKQKIYKLT